VGTVGFSVAGSTWIRGFFAPTGQVANDLSWVAFLVLFMVEDECDVESIGGGGELGGVAIFLLTKKIKNDHKTMLCYVTE